MNNNLLKNLEDLKHFKNKNLSFTLSSRMINEDMDIFEYIKNFYPYLDISQVESLFGFVNQFSPLYGGRGFNKKTTINEQHQTQMNDHDIAVSLTLTNHYFDEENYQKTIPLLIKHHKKGNSIVCVNDELAKRIKKDFPLYLIKASLIKELNTYEKVKKAFEIYDLVVIPMDMNDDDEFLKSLPNKAKIVLFANANCAYNCTSRICYSAISKNLVGKNAPSLSCSKDILPRDQLGHIFFDIKKLYDFGFSNFKLVPNLTIKKELEEKENTKEVLLNIIKKFKKVFYLFSFPKSGRTWLRHILANYINSYYNLNIDINLHTMFNLIPNDQLDMKKGLDSYKHLKDDRFPIIIASHKPLQSYDLENGIILLRNVYDLLVSEYFQHKYYLKRFNGDIKEFIRKKNGSLYGYCKFLNSLAFVENKALIISYEMMSSNIYLVIKELLNYLEIPINDSILENSIKLSTFDNMRKDELKRGMPDNYNDGKNTQGLRMREGKVDNYKTYLDNDDIKYIENYCQNNLLDYSKDILEKLNINFNRSID